MLKYILFFWIGYQLNAPAWYWVLWGILAFLSV